MRRCDPILISRGNNARIGVTENGDGNYQDCKGHLLISIVGSLTAS